jgi:hypothetical protein
LAVSAFEESLCGENALSGPAFPKTKNRSSEVTLLQLQHLNKKKDFAANTSVRQVSPVKKVIFSVVSGGDASGVKAPSEDPFQCREALEIAEDKPHGKLPPVSGGENTKNRIHILLSLLNQHSEKDRSESRSGLLYFWINICT